MFFCKYNRCYDWQLKIVQRGLKKGGYNFSYDSASDWEKESSVYESKEKYTSWNLKYV